MTPQRSLDNSWEKCFSTIFNFSEDHCLTFILTFILCYLIIWYDIIWGVCDIIPSACLHDGGASDSIPRPSDIIPSCLLSYGMITYLRGMIADGLLSYKRSLLSCPPAIIPSAIILHASAIIQRVSAIIQSAIIHGASDSRRYDSRHRVYDSRHVCYHIICYHTGHVCHHTDAVCYHAICYHTRGI